MTTTASKPFLSVKAAKEQLAVLSDLLQEHGVAVNEAHYAAKIVPAGEAWMNVRVVFGGGRGVPPSGEGSANVCVARSDGRIDVRAEFYYDQNDHIAARLVRRVIEKAGLGRWLREGSQKRT
jgi:hypothetical protein